MSIGEYEVFCSSVENDMYSSFVTGDSLVVWGEVTIYFYNLILTNVLYNNCNDPKSWGLLMITVRQAVLGTNNVKSD